jgi:stage III sporulation protein AB
MILFNILISFSIAYIGYGLGDFYVRKQKFIEDILFFFNSTKNDISFLQEDIETILQSNLDSYHSDFKHFAKCYLKIIKRKEVVTYKMLTKNFNTIYLNSSELKTLLQTINNIGKSDVEGQVVNLNNGIESFKIYLNASVEDKVKFASLYKKLGGMAGLVVMILLI